ncbi:uncharacterized protein LOC122262668 [Penaeus japonicus]|uniref:uncharacterized protein LOC122262668 n=1 Tax=Penaeus japonicus TaxID=27405 RepID=UPI001C71586E|nr:uncharacterized protein LOC122262668 [Penaeus japonicus]
MRVSNVLLVCLAVVAMTEAEVLMFDEADFSAPYPLPGPVMDSQGNTFVPLLQGYSVGEWWAGTTVIQVLQADVRDGSDLDKQVDKFLPRNEEDNEQESEQEIVQAVQLETH